jgi:alkaline phosphatase D
MTFKILGILSISTFQMACSILKPNTNTPKTVIAFGSCGHEDKAQPVLSLAASYEPDVFTFLGDNIYGDTDDMQVLEAKYMQWSKLADYQRLKANTRIIATWDDHDYGRNDSGKYYPFKEESKKIFMSHFEMPENHEMRKRAGIYHSYNIEKNGKKVQMILLDVRTFRNDLLLYDGKSKMPRSKYFYALDYMPHTSKDSTLLGEEQWRWLENELKKPADLRFICSGTQFGIEFNGYEAWANFPHEQERMYDLLKKSKAEGVIFLTGDVHYAEISKRSEPGLYPIYDVTASGITSTWDFATPNRYRVEGPVMENHFGLITIQWTDDPIIKMECIDVHNNSRFELTVLGSDLKFKQ